MKGGTATGSSPLRKIGKGGGFMGNVIVGAVVLVVVAFAVRSMVKDKKNGKSLQCGGDCKHC